MRAWLNSVIRLFTAIFIDGVFREAPQIACRPNHVMAFARCISCNRVYPNWNASMTADEAKERGYLGCRCGSQKLGLCLIPSWLAFWWFAVRGWLIRKVVLRSRVWDPRIVAMEHDLS